jgi:hypothetical protein
MRAPRDTRADEHGSKPSFSILNEHSKLKGTQIKGNVA